MTPRERVVAAMRREPVDYVPCSPLFNTLYETQRRGQPWNFPWSPSEDGTEYLVNVLGVDPVVGVWWMEGMFPEEGVGSRVWQEGEILYKAWETPSGVLRSAVVINDRWPFGRDIPFFHDFVGHYREQWLKGEADLECLKHIMLPPRTPEQIEGLRVRVERAKERARRFHLPTMATIGSGLTSALYMFGTQELCLLTVDNPGLVDAYLEVEHQWNLRLMELSVEWGVDIIRRNGFYESADYYGPATLKRFLEARLRREADTVHQGGGTIAYTLFSGIMPILDYLAGIDFDCIATMDIVYGGVDLHEVNAKLGDRKSFWTGPSNPFHLYADDPEVVRRAVRDVFAAFGKTGLLITPCSSAHPMMPWENTLAMVDEWRKLR